MSKTKLLSISSQFWFSFILFYTNTPVFFKFIFTFIYVFIYYTSIILVAMARDLEFFTPLFLSYHTSSPSGNPVSSISRIELDHLLPLWPPQVQTTSISPLHYCSSLPAGLLSSALDPVSSVYNTGILLFLSCHFFTQNPAKAPLKVHSTNYKAVTI